MIRTCLLGCLLLVLGPVGRALAQPVADSVLAGAVPIAAFDDARAMAIDPFGFLYVVDAGQAAVVKLAPGGVPVAVLGGPGSAEGEFDEPSDVDPTNGLVLLVADAGNGRVQRFSKAFAFLGAFLAGRVDASSPVGARSTYRRYEERSDVVPVGRPVAVASAGANDVFAVDADQHVVLKWDAQRRLVDAIGSYGEGEGALADPVAVATDGTRSLFVADRGHRSVLVYDLFGGYVRAIGAGRLDDVRALVVRGGHLWVVLPERLLVYETEGRLSHSYGVPLGEPLVDIAFGAGRLYLLTPGTLYERPW